MSSDLRRHRAAIAAMFFVNGTLFATWVSRIPSIKETMGPSEARLGIALLAIGVGTLSALPLTNWLIARHGSRWVVSASAIACCTTLPLAGGAPSFRWLVLVLALFGAGLGSMDVAMNSQAALLERTAGRSIMSSFHGLWSLGGLVGASLGGGFAAQGDSPHAHFLVVCATLALVALGATRGLVRDGGVPSSPAPLAWPSRAVLAIGLVGTGGAVIEGGIADWSGVFLRDALGTSAGFAASGFAAFSLAMMVGRFTGDLLIDRFGGMALLRTGSVLTGAAVATALLWGDPHVAVGAFALAGLGMSTVFPINPQRRRKFARRRTGAGHRGRGDDGLRRRLDGAARDRLCRVRHLAAGRPRPAGADLRRNRCARAVGNPRALSGAAAGHVPCGR